LENNFNFGAFTRERLRIINILGSQLMISLENAMLVARLKQNSQELQQKNDALKEVDRMKDEFLGNVTCILFLIFSDD
jgi:GAF domain-containing protein